MKREIKFRAWDNHKRDYLYGPFHIIGECTMFNLLAEYTIEDFDRLNIEQFTGIKDCKGVDVYEGDIVDIRSGEFHDGVYEIQARCQIIFSYGSFNPVAPDKCGYNFGEIDIIEVVGNIHKTPELLL